MSTSTITKQKTSPYRYLTQEQIDDFNINGFVKIGKIINDELIGKLRKEYDRIFYEAKESGNFRNLSIDDTQDLDEKINADEQMLQIMQMSERSIHFRKLLYHELILDIAEDLIGPNIQLFHDQALFKPAQHGGSVFWHQDNAYWKCVPAKLISCWLTLDDVDVTNGAMHLLAQSHLKPTAHERTKKGGELFDIGHTVDKDRATIVDLPAGGVLFHHCQTLHYTPSNNTDRQRRAFAIHLMPPGTRRIDVDESLEVSFSQPLLRMRA